MIIVSMYCVVSCESRKNIRVRFTTKMLYINSMVFSPNREIYDSKFHHKGIVNDGLSFDVHGLSTAGKFHHETVGF
jgi:hypothetical protein